MEMFALQAARRLSREDMAEPTITNNIGESRLLKEAQITSQNFPFSRFITKQRTTIPLRDGPLTGMVYPPLKDFPAEDYSCLSTSLAVNLSNLIL